MSGGYTSAVAKHQKRAAAKTRTPVVARTPAKTPWLTAVGARFRHLRKLSGKRQNELSSHTTVRSLEDGRGGKLSSFEEWCVAIGIRPIQVFGHPSVISVQRSVAQPLQEQPESAQAVAAAPTGEKPMTEERRRIYAICDAMVKDSQVEEFISAVEEFRRGKRSIAKRGP